jgi:glycosyltransferase involved in cell wall biosynthesis
MEKPRLLRITTVPISLHVLLTGQFRYMTEQGFEVLTASADGKEVADVEAEGVGHVIIPFTRKITPFRDIRCLWKLIQVMRKFQPHIVHTHTPKAGLLGMFAATVAGVRVRLHTVAGLPFMEASGMKQWLLRRAERMTYRFAHRVYPNSLGLKNYIEETFGTTGEKFQVLGKGSSNGIDIARFSRTPELQRQATEIRSSHGIGDDEFVFCFVGRIVRDKGIVELVDAFTRLSAGRRVRLLIVGHLETDLDPLPATTLDALQHHPGIIMTGFQADVRPWLLASDGLALLSYREGFPNVVMQAFALEIPCLVTDINGSNELVREGETGMIVPAKAIDRTFDAMLTMMTRRDREAMGKSARDFVVRNYDRTVFWKLLLDEYKARLRAAFGDKKFGER